MLCHSRAKLTNCMKDTVHICVLWIHLHLFILWCQEASSSLLFWRPWPTIHSVARPPHRSRLHWVASFTFISTQRNNDFKPVMKLRHWCHYRLGLLYHVLLPSCQLWIIHHPPSVYFHPLWLQYIYIFFFFLFHWHGRKQSKISEVPWVEEVVLYFWWTGIFQSAMADIFLSDILSQQSCWS